MSRIEELSASSRNWCWGWEKDCSYIHTFSCCSYWWSGCRRWWSSTSWSSWRWSSWMVKRSNSRLLLIFSFKFSLTLVFWTKLWVDWSINILTHIDEHFATTFRIVETNFSAIWNLLIMICAGVFCLCDDILYWRSISVLVMLILKFQHFVIRRSKTLHTRDRTWATQNYLTPTTKTISGEPGLDYPIYTRAPDTPFSCSSRPDGLYADVDSRCQSWHQCLGPDRMWTFLCPNGTIFNQEIFTCVWWFDYDCQSSVDLYYLNDNLYKDDATEDVFDIIYSSNEVDPVTVAGPTPLPAENRRFRRGYYRNLSKWCDMSSHIFKI